MIGRERKRVPAAVQRKLIEYYGGKTCVVEGVTDLGREGRRVHWAHLDDDPRRSTFVNLVPLSDSLNETLGDIAKYRDPSERRWHLRPSLNPNKLQARAEERFLNWQSGLAYGCSRLGFFVARDYAGWPGSDLLELASKSLYYVRHKPDPEIIVDVIERDVLSLLRDSRRRFQLGALADIVHNLAELLSEYGQHRTSLELYDKLKSWPLFPGWGSDIEVARSRRREAIPLIYTGSKVAGALLHEAKDLAGGTPKLVVDLATTEAWQAVIRGDLSLAYRLSAEHIDSILTPLKQLPETPGRDRTVTGFMPPWTVAELARLMYATTRGKESASAREIASWVWQHCGPIPLEIPGLPTLPGQTRSGAAEICDRATAAAKLALKLLAGRRRRT
jgi:hypothetical protein